MADNKFPIRFTSPEGRAMAVRRMKMSEQLDFIEACGRNSGNPAWRSMAMIVCSICEFDGQPIIMPNSVEKVRALIDKVGEDGYFAALKALTEDEEADDGSSPEVNLDIAKN